MCSFKILKYDSARIFVTILNIAMIFTCGQISCHDYPVIGVLSQEITDPVISRAFPNATTYIYATYVKAVESAAARVVPIVPGKNESYYRKLLSSINGVLLPGGGAPIAPGHPYYDTAKKIYEIAIELNEGGGFFPLLGVCLGFEFMAVFASGKNDILTNCSIFREYSPLRFSVPPLETHLYSRMELDEYYTLQYSNSTVNAHWWCVLVDDFSRLIGSERAWKMTATSIGQKNQLEYVASMEHARYPFFAVQFHPEVIAFEWSNATMYPRSETTVRANKYFYETFVHFARQNNHNFDAKSMNKLLIYNYSPVYARYFTGNKRQIYLFYE